MRSGDGWCPFAIQVEGAKGFTAGGMDRVGFCDHKASGTMGTMLNSGFWNDPDGKPWTDDAVAVHGAIARDGRIVQIVNIFDSPFAQGRLGPVVSWPPYVAMGRRSPNLYLISTEHEDYAQGADGIWRSQGDTWTALQYAADLKWKRWCIDEIKRVKGYDVMRFGLDSLAGHHMFDGVDRAGCPGSDWRTTYRARLFEGLQGDEDMFTRLNVVSSWYDDPDHQSWSGTRGINCSHDFGLPDDAKTIQLEIWTHPDSQLIEARDGDEQGPSHRGFSVEPPALHFDGRVELESVNGELWAHMASASAHLRRVVCMGYWR